MTLDCTLVAEKERTACNMVLIYRLLRSEKDGRDSYSVTVTKTDTETGLTEERTASDVTSLSETAEHIFALISNGTVTPMTLFDVVGDLLS